MIHADEELRISGAFKDGDHVVVEPLALLLLYPDSHQDGNPIQLAQHLCALHSCLVEIASEITRCCISTPSCRSLCSKKNNLARPHVQQAQWVVHVCSPRFTTL